jgi:histidinol-phosphatase (PHP family)
MLADWPFDSVIISLHNMDGTKDIFVDRSVYDQGVMPAYSRALSQMAAMLLACPGARILGHFDYISRYVPGTPVRMDYAPLAEEFDALFATLIESGRALELNTRTVLKFQQLGLSGEQAWPDPAIFRRYADMGGAYVTLGSDTHQIGQAATLFPEALAYLRWVGIRQITHFVQGKPVVTSLY